MINYADLADSMTNAVPALKPFKCDYCGQDTTECRRAAKIKAPCGA